MTIAASKVKSVCTAAEIELVRASRPPQLEELTAAQLRRQLARTRKLLEKWQDQGRGQSRARNRKEGFGDLDANTRLKREIFEETLAKFEARLAKVDRAAKPKAAAPKPAKKVRAVKHRAARAEVRKELAEVEASFAAPAPPPVKQPLPLTATMGHMPLKTAPKRSPAAAPATVAAPAAPRRVKPVAVKAAPPKKTKVNPAKQRAAVTAAKHARVLKSGKTTADARPSDRQRQADPGSPRREVRIALAGRFTAQTLDSPQRTQRTQRGLKS